MTRTTIDTAREAGFDWGYDLATTIRNEGCTGDQLANAVHEADEHARQYTPFEFIARDLNSVEGSDFMWEAFEDGIEQAIAVVARGE